jgi:uncharacterized Fe-S cluster-containing MiaB family protein
MIIPPDAFLTIGNTISSIRTIEGQRAITFFKTTYGINHEVCSHTWEFNDNVSNKAKKIQSKTLTVGFNTAKIIWYRNMACLIVGYKQNNLQQTVLENCRGYQFNA